MIQITYVEPKRTSFNIHKERIIWDARNLDNDIDFVFGDTLEIITRNKNYIECKLYDIHFKLINNQYTSIRNASFNIEPINLNDTDKLVNIIMMYDKLKR